MNANVLIIASLIITFNSVRAMDWTPDGDGDEHYYAHSPAPGNERPSEENQPEAKRRRLEAPRQEHIGIVPSDNFQAIEPPMPWVHFPPDNTGSYGDLAPMPGSMPWYQNFGQVQHQPPIRTFMVPLQQRCFNIVLPPDYQIMPQVPPSHHCRSKGAPLSNGEKKWQYVISDNEKIGRIDFDEKDPGKIPWFLVEHNKQLFLSNEKRKNDLDCYRKERQNREPIPFKELTNALSCDPKFGVFSKRRVNIQFGRGSYHLFLDLDYRIYDLIGDKETKEKIAVIFYEIWNRSPECADKGRNESLRHFEREFVRFLLKNQYLISSAAGNKKLLDLLNKILESINKNITINNICKIYFAERRESKDSFFDRLHSPIWSIVNPADYDHSLDLLSSVQNMERLIIAHFHKLLYLNSNSSGVLSGDVLKHIGLLLHLLFLSDKY